MSGTHAPVFRHPALKFARLHSQMRRTPTLERVAACRAGLRDIAPLRAEGRVTGLSGLVVDIDGLSGHVCVGDRLLLEARDGNRVAAEIVGFRQGLAQAMPFGALDGLGPGSTAQFQPQSAGGHNGATLSVSNDWLGRVLDPLGRPLDGHGPLPVGPIAHRVRAGPPEATQRARLGPRIDVGVRALNSFATCRQGQRLGLFAGSGVGSRRCWPCWRATPPATSQCLPWSASEDARCGTSWRTIWARQGSSAPSWWLPPRTLRRCCAGRQRWQR